MFSLGHALAIEHAAHDVVTNAGQVADTAAAHEHDRVLLKVVPLAADVGRDLLAVREPNPGHLAEGRVGLFGGHRLDLQADPSLERGRFEHRRFGLVFDGASRLSDKLVDRGHEFVVPLEPRKRRLKLNLSLVADQGAGGFAPTQSIKRQACRVSEAAAGSAQSRWHAMRGQTVQPGRNPRSP